MLCSDATTGGWCSAGFAAYYITELHAITFCPNTNFFEPFGSLCVGDYEGPGLIAHHELSHAVVRTTDVGELIYLDRARSR
jgi:hypothetical protein